MKYRDTQYQDSYLPTLSSMSGNFVILIKLNIANAWEYCRCYLVIQEDTFESSLYLTYFVAATYNK